MERFKDIIEFGKRVFEEWSTDQVPRLAAALAYYTVFALAPLMVITVAIAGLVFGADAAQKQVVTQFGSLVGQEGAQVADQLLSAQKTSTNILATIISFGLILLGASGVVGELKGALNAIWNVAPKPGRGLFGTFIERVFSVGIVLAFGFLMLVSLLLSAGLAALGTYIQGVLQEWAIVAQVLEFVISFGGIALVFALLFKFLPDVRIAWRDVWVGALITALLFSLGKYAIGMYISRSNIATPFGAAGSLIVLLVWAYYAAQIVFLGAEITQVYASRYGSGVRPAPDAIPLSDAARVEQGTRTLTPPNAARGVQPQVAGQPNVTGQANVAGQTNVAQQPVSQPHRVYQPAHPIKPFNPIQLVAGAVGVRVFGAVKNGLEYVSNVAGNASGALK